MIIRIQLPQIVRVNDYHDFSVICSSVNKLAGTNVEYIEVTPNDLENFNGYFAVIYAGVKPSKDVIRALVKENKWLKDKTIPGF